MNRYSLVFAMIVAASFVAPTPQTGDAPHPAAVVGKRSAARGAGSEQPDVPFAGDPNKAVQSFLDLVGSGASPDPKQFGAIFVAVPHPTETHLAADFDENIAALESGLQQVGYLFDSVWIPWQEPREYERLEDNVGDQGARDTEDAYPGMLFFRKDVEQETDPYASGLVVFLIAEKPTAGLSVKQVQNAIKILTANKVPAHMPGRKSIGIIGPNYTGSLGSLGPALIRLHGADTEAPFLIRGGVLAGKKSILTMERLAALPQLSGISMDFASSAHNYIDSNNLAVTRLTEMGICPEEIAFLSEDESSYGSLGREEKTPNPAIRAANTDSAIQARCKVNQPTPDFNPSWHISFPRDISSLRTTYDEQGLLNRSLPAEPWKRFLNLKSATGNDSDSVPTFGGASSVAAQESILFGISSFLNTHDIHAIVLSATNEEDAYFLSQFFHTNNSNVRIVVIGATRLFLRGSTAQFRGDLAVDDFPMLPRLNDWTSSPPDPANPHFSRVEQIFATGYAQGVYVATIDLLQPNPNSDVWFPEYSTPDFDPSHAGSAPTLRPPMYLTSLGIDSPWPVDVLANDHPFKFEPTPSAAPPNSQKQQTAPTSTPTKWKVELPFTLFQHDDPPLTAPPSATMPQAQSSKPKSAPVTLFISQYWCIIFLAIWLQVALYCVCFVYAKPVARQLCASFEPVAGGRYWCFTVILPALLIGSVFSLLDRPLVTLSLVSKEIFWWHIAASASSFIAPLLNAVLPCIKAGYISKQVMPVQSSEAPPSEPLCKGDRSPLAPDPGWHIWKLLAFVPALFFLLLCLVRCWFASGATPGLGIVLNAYREMHLRSGLSLLPTWLLLCLGLFCWIRQASIGSALLIDLPRLPDFPVDTRISTSRGESIGRDSRPIPTPEPASAILRSEIKWLYIVWAIAVLLMIGIVFYQHSFAAITTLEPHAATRNLKFAMLAVGALMLLDVLQFFWVWDRLRTLLNALDSRVFKRSFVPIDGFKWSGLWSFAGVSFSGQKAILTALVDCVEELLKHSEERNQAGSEPLIDTETLETARAVVQLRLCYRSKEMTGITSGRYRKDLKAVHEGFAKIGDALVPWMENQRQGNTYPAPREFPLMADSFRKALACQCEEKHGPYACEADQVTRLLPWQQTVERFLCLLYISFIQAIISRLHRLMLSVAALFSSFTVAIAIYPFAPMQPFLLGGVTFLIILAVAFYMVFSQMDTNPVLSRIVNGDERKLAWSFYGKFAESIALPALTLMSSFLPGGTGRVLEVLTKLVSHGQ